MNDAKPDVASLPANCRQRLMHEGKAYPRSGCAACGQWMPRAKECEAALAKPASGDGLPELPEPLKQVRVYADHGPASREPEDEVFDADQMRAIRDAGIAYGRRLATPEQPGSSVQGEEYPEAAEVCAEAYQVVGSLLDELGLFGTEKGDKILDNLAACKLVHKDILPWRTFDAATPPPAPAAEQGKREADRRRFPDPDFNAWLDQGISDCGHTVWDAVGDVQAAWQGWEAAILAQPEARGVEGMVLVPREPTEAMREAFISLNHAFDYEAGRLVFTGDSGQWLACYRAMLAAAPEPVLAAAPAAPGVRVDEAMVGDVRADIMRSAANDGCPIVIKDAWVREALTAALAPDGGEGE